MKVGSFESTYFDNYAYLQYFENDIFLLTNSQILQDRTNIYHGKTIKIRQITSIFVEIWNISLQFGGSCRNKVALL